MNKKLEVGQRWAHFKDDNNWGIYEIINILPSGLIEDTVIKQTEGYNGAIGEVLTDADVDNYFGDMDMQPVIKTTPLWRTLNE